MRIERVTGFCVLVLPLAAALAAAEEPKYGAITVNSEPAGARAYVEGFLAGETPVKVEQLLPGDYRVVVKQEGHADFVQDVKVAKGQIVPVEAKLAPDPSAWSSPVRAEDDWTPVLDKDKERYEKATSKAHLGDYKVLQVSNFLMKSDETVPPDHLYALLPGLATQLDKKTRFAKFATNYTKGPSPRWAASGEDPNEPTLVLSGVITKYQRGSRTTRYLVGFGAGKTRCYCLFRLTDKKTGDVVFERMENGSVSGGGFGGASSDAMKELAEDIAKAVKGNW
jgi:hypothetical protein